MNVEIMSVGDRGSNLTDDETIMLLRDWCALEMRFYDAGFKDHFGITDARIDMNKACARIRHHNDMFERELARSKRRAKTLLEQFNKENF